MHAGLSRFGRDVVAECNRLGIVVDCAHASFATTMAVLEASSQPVIISHGQLGYPDDPTPAPPADERAARGRGGRGRRPGRRLALRNHQPLPRRLRHRDHPAGRGGRPGPRGLGTDLDGNYRPVLTSYDQLDDLTGLLGDRGLPAARIHQILGGNALKLLGRVL